LRSTLRATLAVVAALSTGAVSAVPAMARGGDLDASFGEGGVFHAHISSGDDNALDAAVQADGRIVVVGTANGDFAVVRLLANGALDTSFGGGDGVVTTDFAGAFDSAYGVAIQTDGRIVAAGTASTVNDLGYTYDHLAVARYTIDGVLDGTFAQNGKFMKAGLSNTEGNDVALQQDGKIVVGGYLWGQTDGADFLVVRLNAGGAVDTSFGNQGQRGIDFGGEDQAYSLGLQSDGKIILGGTAGLGADWALARLTTSGNLDNTFSGDGLITNVWGRFAVGRRLAIMPDDRIVMIGDANITGVARFTKDGQLDPTFSRDGLRKFRIADGAGSPYAVTLQGKRIVLAGQYSNQTFVVRLSYKGPFDSTFGSNGQVITSVGAYFVIHSLAIDAQGRLVGAAVHRPNTLNDALEFAALRVLSA
jgi:uncharacterized delta-60 repeat protein